MNVDQLQLDVKERIVMAGVEMMSAITEAFGPEEGIRVWESLSSSIGLGMKEAVFLEILVGGVDIRKITIRCKPDNVILNSRFIDLIKCIRNYTGLGLKEAKDIADDLRSMGSISFKIDPTKKAYCMKELKSMGFDAI